MNIPEKHYGHYFLPVGSLILLLLIAGCGGNRTPEAALKQYYSDLMNGRFDSRQLLRLDELGEFGPEEDRAGLGVSYISID